MNRVAYRGERFLLMRDRRPVAELGPVPVGRFLRELPVLLESLPRLSAEEAESFADDLSAARSELADVPPADRWAS
ncbi:MAG: hypothetical protein ACRELV_13310 [Longimicrobiales bacterium]